MHRVSELWWDEVRLCFKAVTACGHRMEVIPGHRTQKPCWHCERMNKDRPKIRFTVLSPVTESGIDPRVHDPSSMARLFSDPVHARRLLLHFGVRYIADESISKVWSRKIAVLLGFDPPETIVETFPDLYDQIVYKRPPKGVVAYTPPRG